MGFLWLHACGYLYSCLAKEKTQRTRLRFKQNQKMSKGKKREEAHLVGCAMFLWCCSCFFFSFFFSVALFHIISRGVFLVGFLSCVF